MLSSIILIRAAFGGTDIPNWTLHVMPSNSTPLGLRAHIGAYSGLSSPADIDYRLMLAGHAHGPKITSSQHASLKTAAGTSGACTTFNTTMITVIGATWWATLSGPEQQDACTLYQHLAGGTDPGLVWWLEVHQQLDGENTNRQYGLTEMWEAIDLAERTTPIVVNTTTGAVTNCGSPELSPLVFSSREAEEKVAICDLLASVK